MYAIHLKGRKEPIEVEDQVGQNLKIRWGAFKNDGARGGIVQLDDISFEMSSVRVIEGNYNPTQTEDFLESKRAKNVREMREDGINYAKWWKGIISQSPQTRAQNLMIPKLVWFSHTGSYNIPEDIAEAIIILQQDFFEQNPRSAWASPLCYKDLIPHTEEMVQSETPSIGRISRDNVMRFVESCLSADYREQKYNTL